MKIFKSLSILLLAFTINACSPNSNNTGAFTDVDKITVEKLNLDASRELIIEITDEAEIEKIIGFINLEKSGSTGCDFQVLLTFHKSHTSVEGFANVNPSCSSIAYTYNSNFYTKNISIIGANYIKRMSGI